MADVVYLNPGRDSGGRGRPLLRTVIGDALRRARLAQGRTLADVAREARVSMPYLSEVERGLKEASSEVLAAVCDALRIQLADVLAEAGRGLTRRARPAWGRPAGPVPASTENRVGTPAHRPGDVVLLAA